MLQIDNGPLLFQELTKCGMHMTCFPHVSKLFHIWPIPIKGMNSYTMSIYTSHALDIISIMQWTIVHETTTFVCIILFATIIS